MSLLALNAPRKTRSGGVSLKLPQQAGRTVTHPLKLTQGRSQQLLELVCKVGEARVAGLALMSAGGDLVDLYTHGLSADAAAQLVGSAQLAALVQHVMTRAEPVTVARPAEALAPLARTGPLPLTGPFLGMPVNFPGSFGGILFLCGAPERPAFSPQEVETVALLRAWLEQGDAVEDNHLFAQLRLLNRVAQAAAGNLDLDLILERALGELDHHFPLHVTAVWLLDSDPDDQLTLAATRSIPSTRAAGLDLVPGKQLPLGNTPFDTCRKTGQGMYYDFGEPVGGTPGPQAGARPLTQALAARGATCFFAAPLRAGDQTLGFLQSICTHQTGFTGEQIQLLYLVADLLGPAISNSRLIHRLQTTCEELRAAQEHLIRVEKMRALGELASGMAHDFNNSLCGVLGFLDLTLMDKGLSSSSRNYLESARTCALDAAQTVRRVQDFSRFRRSTPVFQPLDLNELLRQTVELTRPKWEGLNPARNRPITVAVQAEATSRCSGCPAEIREVLTNLVFNAVDAMPQGGTLTLRTWSTRGDVHLAIADTGVGMSAAVRQRLFEPFFTTKGDRGNGLGLSIAFGIIQNHQGNISVQSKVGQGTVFTIRLPAVVEKEAPPARPEAKAQGPAIEPSSVGLRILVVDDEEAVRQFLERALKHLGHRPCLAVDGPQALALFAAEPFDLVVTDLGLPGLPGDELARTLAERAPQVPVLLLTGYADEFTAGSRVLPGVRRILGKPITLKALTETLGELFPGS